MMADYMSIKQNEIYLVEFFPKIGDEISKKRPAIVVSDDGVGKLKHSIQDTKLNYCKK